MGGGGKQTNQLLNEQRQLGNQYAGQMGDRSQSEYDYKTGLRNRLTNELWNQYGSAPTTTGGRAAGWNAPGYQDIYNQYSDLSKTGGWTPEQMQGFRSWTTAPISGFYSGMKNQLERANAATGGFAGYNSQARALGRDAARQGYQTALESESSLQDKIRAAKLQGLQGMSSTLGQGWHQASAGSAGGPGTQDYYLRQLQGMMGDTTDLPYAQMAQQGYNQGYQGVVNRQQGQGVPWGTIGSVAGTALIVL